VSTRIPTVRRLERSLQRMVQHLAVARREMALMVAVWIGDLNHAGLPPKDSGLWTGLGQILSEVGQRYLVPHLHAAC
jgi:hypothetical protein